MTDDEGWTALHYSAREGSCESVRLLFAMGSNIKHKTKNGKNCLHIAADYGHLNLCTTLINEHNIDVQLPDNHGWTAFHYFAKKGSYGLLIAFADLGIDINLRTNNGENCLHIAADNGHLNLSMTLINKYNIDVRLPDNQGWTAFHYIAKNGSYKLVKAVSDMGIDINHKTNNAQNCLHIAAENNNFNLCRKLISKHNIDVQLPDNDGWNALHYSAKSGSYELVQAFADMGTDIKLQTNDGKDCLHIAAKNSHFNLCMRLINHHSFDAGLPDIAGWTALHYFVENGSYELVKVVADMGIDINLKTNNGKNCLHIAAENNNLNLCRKLISKHKIDVQLPDNDGWNALHYFAKSGSYEFVKAVSDMGFDINLKTNNGKNCLHIAAENNNFNLCRQLISKHKIDVQLPDNDGWNALHYFAKNGSYEFVKAVSDMGFDINLKTNNGKNCLHIAAEKNNVNLCRKLMSRHKIDVQLPDNDGWNALHYFAKNGSYELVKVAAEMGTDIKLQTNDGKNCLHIAAKNSHFNMCMTLINKHNFDARLPDFTGWTALHYFAESGSYELVKTVGDMGIDINLKTNNGKNCLHIAADNRHFNLCKKLISKRNVDVQTFDHDGWAPLHYFAKRSSYELIKTVVDMEIDINLKTSDGKNCLHIAADNGHFSLCRSLINKYDVDMELPDNDGWNASHYFSKTGSYELVKLLADIGTEIKLQTSEGKDCLHIAAENSHFNLCMKLINKHNFDAQLPDFAGWTALHYFAQNGSYELVNAVADMGIDINLKTNNGKNCLHIAADNRYFVLCKNLISKRNIDVQIPDHDGWVPLHYFAKRSSYELVKTVADMGIEINLKTNNGKNCLHIAAENNNFNLCRKLISKHKIDVQLPDNDGWNALHYFAKNGSYEFVKAVSDMGFDINLKTNNGKNCLHIAAEKNNVNLCRKLMSRHKIDVQLPDNDGWNALHYFAKNGSYELVKVAAEMGTDIKLQTNDGKNCLHIAAKNSHFNMCMTLINKHNFDARLPDFTGWTALHYFAESGSYELVKTVGDMGIDINLKTNNGKNCLHIAADNRHFNLCKKLISKRNVDVQTFDHDGWAPLHYFAKRSSYELIKTVVDMEIDINLKTSDGKNCLHIAADNGHFSLCRSLINKYDVDMELPDNDGWNASHYFSKTGSYELVKLLADIGTEIKLQTSEGKDCLHIAAENSHFNLCMELINKHNFDAQLPDFAGWTAVHYFAQNGSYELVNAVADMGIDINLKTNNGKNCLHIAADNRYFVLCKNLISKRNVDVQIPDHDGWVPLHYFAKRSSYELVKTVADMGIEINLKTNNGKNCLHIAAENNNFNLCRKLISKHKIDVQLPDNDGWNALHYFAKNGSYEFVKAVSDMGFDINLKTNNGKNFLHIAAEKNNVNLCRKLMSRHKIDVQLPDNDGWNALHYFAKNGSYELVKVAAEMGTDIKLQTNDGKNCLHIAAKNSHFNMCMTLINKHNFDARLPDFTGWTALHYFAESGSYELVKTVGDMGIDINLKTNNGKNCLHIAADNRHFNLCKKLISKRNVDVQTFDHDGWAPLHYFAKRSSYELIKTVVDMEIDINLKTSDGKNCLHIAADNGHFSLCRSLINKYDVDIELPDNDGWNASHYFSKTGSYELVKLLADIGTEIKLQTSEGKDCLHIAAENSHFNLCMELINKHNFDAQLPDFAGWTAVHYFAQNGSYELVNAVAYMGIDINLKTNNGKNCLHIAADNRYFVLCKNLISKRNVDVQIPDHDGWVPLHYFAKRSSYELVKTVADMGIEINLKTNNGKNCLHIAAENNNFNLCRKLISKHKIDVQLPDNDGWNALHYFAKNGSYEFVKAVSDMGFDINLKTNNGKNCLHIAAEKNNVNLCRKLMSRHKIDVQLPDNDGWNALHYFAKNGSYELVKVAAEMGTDIKLQTNDGKNCLHIAAKNSHFNMCMTLINKHNFDARLPDFTGWTALHYFAESGSYELVKTVGDMGIDINLKTNNGKNCLHIAADNRHFNLCKKLISKRNVDVQTFDHDGWAPLHYFAKSSSYELIKTVVDMEIDINLKTSDRKNCLHIAADNGHFSLCRSLINKYDVDMELPDNDGWNASHYFSKTGSYELVKLLADIGTEIKLQTSEGKDCLHIAAENSHFNLCMELINKHNFDAQLPDFAGWTALHYFAQNGSYELVNAVADMGIDINLKTNNGKNCLHIAADNRYFVLCKNLISKRNVDVQIPDHDGWVPLHYFAKRSSYELVKTVADMGIEINLKTKNGKNCLHIAAENNNFNLCRKLISKHKIDVQLPDNDGWNALHYFAKNGSYEFVKAVSDMGFDINLKTNNGKNCLHIAAEKNNVNLCRKLMSRHKIDVQLPDNDGWNALHYFAKNGSYELVKVAAEMGTDIKLQTNDGKNCLHIAAKNSHFNMCMTLINKHNFDARLPDFTGWTALHYFAESGSYELVKTVGDMGIDINLKTNNGKNCLHIAADNRHFNLCKKLISKRNVNVQTFDHDGWAPLHYFAKRSSYELIKTVVDMEIDINLKTSDGKNCLHIAADNGHFSLCRSLINKYDVDMELPDNDGWNASHYFSKTGSYELVKLLADIGTEIKLQTSEGKDCLHIAAENSHFNLCMKLINKLNFDAQLPDFAGWTAVHYFAQNGSYELVNAVADMGIDINLKTNNGKNCLHIAADNRYFVLCKNLISKRNVDVQIPDHDGWVPLHYFAKRSSYELVKTVADMGIEINLKTNNGKNCLHIAAENNNFNLCRKLISKHKIDVQLPDNDGWNALHYFAKNDSYKLVKAVSDMGIDINLKTNNGKNCLHIAAEKNNVNLCRKLISKHKIDVQLPDNDGWNALHYFAKNDSYKLVKAVSDMGIDINLKTNNGKNCLHIAAENNNFNLCRKLISKHKIDVQLPDNDGWNALHYSAKIGSYELVQAFAYMGTDIKLQTNDGKDCLHIAAKNSHFNLCMRLINHHSFDAGLPDIAGWTALHYFVENGSYELVKVVADMGIDINLKTNNGKNCLHIAAEKNNLNLCRQLISKHKIDVQLPDNDGWNALHYFAKSGSYELVKVVADMGTDIKLKTNEGKNCLHIAADNGHLDLCSNLISKHNLGVQLPDNDGWNTLHYFAKNDSYKLVKAVPDMGFDINLKTNNGKNCLHIAAERNNVNLCRKLMSRHKIDVQLPDNDGWNALHYFAKNGSYELVKVAAEMGTDIKLQTNDGKNCLHIAAKNSHFNMCMTLINKHNFDARLPDFTGWTALHYFAESGSYELVKAVADMGIDINLKTNNGKNCLHIAADNGHFSLCRSLINKYDVDMELPDNDGWNASHYFSKTGSYELVKLLADMGTEIKLQTSEGKDCLHIAAENSHFNLCMELINKHNFDAQLPDFAGWTAVHYFAQNGSYELVKVAAEMGTDIKLQTNDGKNCLHIAAKNSHFNMCMTLINKHNFDARLPDFTGWTALHYFAESGSYELVKAVADMGIDINLKTNNGKNCLHIAADNGHFSLCRSLINKYDVDMELPDNDGWNASHYFSKTGSYELVKLLADMGTEIKLQTSEGKDCLHIAAENSHFNLCMELINKHNFDAQLPDFAGWTAVHYFAQNGSYELVNAVADMGIDINLKTNNGKNCLHIAADNRHFVLCKNLISKRNVDVQIPDHDGWVPLHYFAKRSSYELVKTVAEMGIDINLKTNDGKNSLHIAADFGHFKLCGSLINKHNVDMELPDNDGWNALHYFAENGSYELIKVVADLGIDINLKTNDGKNCVHIAADRRRFSLCRMLINKHNVDMQFPDNDGWTALHYFAKNGSYELVKVVADMGTDIKLQTNEGQDCLHIAADNSHFNLCMALINKHDFDARLPDLAGMTALHYFAQNGSYELVNVVADMGIDINLKTNNGKNCLHIAADNRHFHLCKNLISKRNPDVEIPDHDGWTPLHYFAKRNGYELVQTVADMGIDINLKTNDGKNCLQIAADHGHLSFCRVLINKHNADMKLPDNDGWNALHYFAKSGSYELIKVVSDMGTDIKLQTNDGKNCLHIAADNSHLNLSMRLINKHNFDARLPDHAGRTALHYFAQNGSYELVNAIADMGIDINLKTNNGKNCLHIAADNRHFNLCKQLISKRKIDVQLPDHDGWAPLHYCAKRGSYELVQTVADMGNDINLKTNDGKNCLQIAADHGHLSFCRVLINKHNADMKLPDNDGWNALHYFAKSGSYELIKVVSDMGTDIKVQTNDGKNCLHVAADNSHLNLSMRLINKHNFDARLPDHAGRTALHYFAQNGSYELVNAIADMGIDINLKTNNGKNCLHIAADNRHFNLCKQLIRKRKVDVQIPDHDGWAPLHYFAKRGSYELVQTVADMGNDINLKTNDGKNCLQIAADYGHLSFCRVLINKHNADMKLPDNDGWNALHYFTENCS